MGPTDYYLQVFKKYADFKGRARRSEYWYFALFNLIVMCILVAIDSMTGSFILTGIYYLGVLVPSLAVVARRLHDTNRSAWWFLITFVPLVGGFILLYFMVQDSHPTTNQWGLNPKDPHAEIDDIADHLVE